MGSSSIPNRSSAVSTGFPFGDLKPLSYRTILADPPWLFANYSAKGEAKNPVAHYACMDIEAIKALPVGHLAAPDCVLVMWATAPLLPQAIETIGAWGFRYVTAGAWAKRSRTGRVWTFGTGYWLRSSMEPYLLATLGSPRIRARNVRNLIEAPVREHSRKPDQIYVDQEALTDGPRCELFARTRRPGWDAWGNEAGKFGGGA
jgi:N6-adenosine-specific RNA methylase IME4